MRGERLNTPHVSRRLVRLFALYTHWFLRRNFHSVRVHQAAPLPDRPLLICMNHPSWWDPLVAVEAAMRLMPERTHYAPIDATAFEKYGFFRKLGFFGVEQGTPAGASTFLRTGTSVLHTRNSALWVTGQGSFQDPRVRPVVLKPGIGHLLRRCSGVAVIPMAVEYPFWEERYPEALVHIGEALLVDDGKSRPAVEWTAMAARDLEHVQDILANRSMARDTRAFTVLVGGNAGIGGVYDSWRRLKAWTSGRRFSATHGAERFR